MEKEHNWVIVDGVYLDPLLIDEHDITSKFHRLDPDFQIRQAFDDTLWVLATAAAFWLDHDSGNHLGQAPTALRAIRNGFEGIFQAAEFADPRALAGTIRTSTHYTIEGPDSALVATWAMALAADALSQLWEAQQLIQAAPNELEAALILSEAEKWHGLYLKQAKDALSTAETHQHYEQQAGLPGGLCAWSTLDAAAIVQERQAAQQASSRARKAGEGNKAPESKRQEDVAANRERICKAADRVINNGPSRSFTDLISTLYGQGVASRPTLRKYLAHLKPKKTES